MLESIAMALPSIVSSLARDISDVKHGWDKSNLQNRPSYGLQ